jgi:hypothetical protein
MLNRTERNRVLNYAKNAYKKQKAVHKLFARKEEAVKKTEERYNKMIEDSLDYKEYQMNLEMVKAILKNPDITLEQVLTEEVSQKEIMGNMCNTRTYKPTATFLEKYCGVTTEEAVSESTPLMEAEAAEEIAAEVDEVEAEEENESTDSDSEIPEELNDDF